MDTYGRHLLVEYQGCPEHLLDDAELIERLMKQAALAAGATIVGHTFHRFAPQGVSGVVVVQESHLSIHTWPEYGYAAVDFYTCGECIPEAAHAVLFEGLAARRNEVMIVSRGLSTVGPSMSIRKHETGGHPETTARREVSR